MTRQIIIVLLVVICIGSPGYAQWKYPPQRIDSNNVGHLVSPFQLPFLHRPSQNKLDTIVEVLLDRNIKHIILYSEMIQQIGRMNTKEALSLLYLGCKWRNKDDYKNEFTYLCKMLVENGAYNTINKYFLNNRVSKQLPKANFEKEILLQCEKLQPISIFRY
jgi:hypothetical protein